ncbi:MAG: DUF3570 domain-containing protein [Polyangiaceae bacterium]
MSPSVFRRWAKFVLCALAASAPARVTADPTRWDGNGELSGYYDSDDVTVVTPAVGAKAKTDDGWSARGGYLIDIVSAASVDIVSTASPRWTEVRHAGELGAGFERGNYAVNLSGAASFEPDFVSWTAGLEGSRFFANKQLLLTVGYAFQRDIAGRKGTSFSDYALRSVRHTASTSAELVLDRATTLTLALDVMLESGRQEKPYRYLPLFAADVAPMVPTGASIELVNQLRLPGRIGEQLPDTRRRAAASARLAHRFEHSTLTFWDRIYADGWGMFANTADARWVVEVSRALSLWPALRFHEQSAVSFWRRAYVGSIQDGRVDAPSFRTGDRELSRLWTATAGFGAGLAPSQDLRLSMQLDASYTDFPNTLYIDHRWATFAVAAVDVRLW